MNHIPPVDTIRVYRSTMICDNETCQTGGMVREEPKDRLREARRRLGFTRQQLAAKIGKAQSTVRAHENGQNQISPEMAAAYARELGINPSWLLYGEDEGLTPPPGPKTRVIRVVGEIWDRPFYMREEDGAIIEELLTLSLPEYDDETELSAFRLRSRDIDHQYREYVVVANSLGDLRLIDEVVMRHKEDRFYGLGIWKVGAEKDWAVFYQGPSQSKADKIVKVRTTGSPPGRLDDFFTVLGVVIARLSIRRRMSMRLPQGHQS